MDLLKLVKQKINKLSFRSLFNELSTILLYQSFSLCVIIGANSLYCFSLNGEIITVSTSYVLFNNFYALLLSSVDRARRAVSGTYQFIVGTCDYTNHSGKNSNQSPTSLRCMRQLVAILINI